MLQTLIFLFYLQGIRASSHLPFLPTAEGITTSDIVSRSLGLPDSNGVRRPRNVMSILSLLWPQVVGPIENGEIKEEGYEEIPRTSLENQLEGIRQRSKEQMALRARVRDLINDGVDTSQLNFHELYALNNDMGGYNHHVPHHIYHPLHNYAAAPPYHPQHLPQFNSVIIQDSQIAHFPAFQEIINNLHRGPKKPNIQSTPSLHISPEENKKPQNSDQQNDEKKLEIHHSETDETHQSDQYHQKLIDLDKPQEFSQNNDEKKMEIPQSETHQPDQDHRQFDNLDHKETTTTELYVQGNTNKPHDSVQDQDLHKVN